MTPFPNHAGEAWEDVAYAASANSWSAVVFFTHLFYERWLSACSSGISYPRRIRCAPKLELPCPKLYIYPGFAATETGATREPLAPRTSLNILTYPASCMIMVQLIVRNPID